MLGYYNVSVILTYIGLISSVVGMSFAMGGNGTAAAVCLIICGVCDMFDGTIARATKRSEEAKVFGIQIDSLCDLVSFGVLPAVMLMSLTKTTFSVITASLFVLGAVIRLGYFNVHEQIRQQTTEADKTEFHGLPVTSAAWILPAVYALRSLAGSAFPVVFTVIMLVIAVLFVVNFRLRKPQSRILLYSAGCLWIVLMTVVLIFFN